MTQTCSNKTVFAGSAESFDATFKTRSVCVRVLSSCTPAPVAKRIFDSKSPRIGGQNPQKSSVIFMRPLSASKSVPIPPIRTAQKAARIGLRKRFLLRKCVCYQCHPSAFALDLAHDEHSRQNKLCPLSAFTQVA
jgi:hypothetical protein